MFFKDLYIHISDRLETVLDAQNQPAIRWIDFDLQQLEDDPPPVSFPCALIGFGDADQFDTLPDGSQIGTLNVTLRFGIKLRERTHSKANAAFRDEALAHLDLVEAASMAIQGTEGATFGKILRGSISQEKRKDYRVYSVGYTVQVYNAPPEHITNKYTLKPKANIGFCIHPDM